MTFWEIFEDDLKDDTKNLRLSDFSKDEYKTMCIDIYDVLFYLTYMNEKEIVAFFNAILIDAEYFLKRLKLKKYQNTCIVNYNDELPHITRTYLKWRYEKLHTGEKYEDYEKLD